MKETTLSGASADIRSENLQKLRQIFPEVFCEGSVDFDKLRAVLGETIDEDKERYNFTWWGKSRALRLAQTPSMGTLRPCKAESKNWDTTGNLYIEGDNLEVLKLLQKSYHNRVKMIYIDPPYNTGNDFVYKDDYKDPLQNYLQMTNQLDEQGRKLGTNSEASGRYHTNWLNMMYPRMRLARSLLREEGVIFISIDDNEVSNLRKICDEIFGEENFINQIVWKKSYGGGSKTKYIVGLHEYILSYAKSKISIESIVLPPNSEVRKYYTGKDDKNDTRGPFRTQPLATNSMDERPNLRYPILYRGQEIWPEKQWQWSKKRVEKALKNDELIFSENDLGKWSVRYKQYLFDEEGNERGAKLFSIMEGPYTQVGTNEISQMFGNGKLFPFPKPSELIKTISSFNWDGEEDITLDFFSGSASTAHAVMQLNAEDGGQRKYILVQLPEPTAQDSEAHKAGFANICEIGKERIRRAGEQIKAELIEKQKGQPSLLEGDKRVNPDELDIGFKVFKLDSSNLKKWNPDTKNLEASLLDAVENFVDGRSELDLVYEILLKYGVDLSLPIEEYGAGDSKIYSVGGGALLLCLGRQIGVQVAEELVRLKQKLNPEITRVVFRDNGFTDDSAKTNAKELLRNAGVDEIVSI